MAFEEEYLQQLLVSIMKHRPAQLCIDTLPKVVRDPDAWERFDEGAHTPKVECWADRPPGLGLFDIVKNGPGAERARQVS